MIKNLLLASVAVTALRTVAFMSADHVPTKRIKGADGKALIINESDFDPETHEPFEDVATSEETDENDDDKQPRDSEGNAIEANGEKTIADDQKLRDRISTLNAGVNEKKRRFYIVDANADGAPVDDIPGVDPKGYKSNAEAWAVVMSIKSQATGNSAGGSTPPGTVQPDASADKPTAKLDAQGNAVLDANGNMVYVDKDGNDVPAPTA